MKSTLSARAQKNFQSRLLKWFRTHQRDLPWRSSRDPYRIWVAEVMLQQTRIAAVMPYYQRFLDRFPNVESLAHATQTEVLKLWSGLGYYSRARNLHAAAKEIVAHHNSKFPRDLDAALGLPGIGTYTAAAVLSIAYDVPLAVLDGNVARVLARLHAIRGDVRAPKTWRNLTEIADRLLAKNSASDWNQSLMELGEVICTPQSPRCSTCPVARWCRARAENLTAKIPAPRRKRAPVHMKIAAAILLDPRGRTLLVKDPGAHDGVLFSRMWQFPAVEVTSEPKAALAAHLRATLNLPANASALELEALPTARHGVTFRNIALLPFLARVENLPKLHRTRILPIANLAKLPISSATKKIAAAALSGVLMSDAKITSDHGKEALAGPLAGGVLHPSSDGKPRKSATSS
ncbi:MAG: A/G-specific adenine glycosylase [Candidatus Acidiferrales bacterium]